MQLHVKVIPNSKTSEIVAKDGNIAVKVKEKAEGNKANLAVIKLLKAHYDAGSVKIVKGLKSRNKIIEIIEK